MTIFCNQCGTQSANEDGAGFCDHCGAPLRKPVSTKQPPLAAVNTPAPAVRAAERPTDVTSAPRGAAAMPSPARKTLYAGAALLALLMITGGAAYFALAPPAATRSALLTVAKEAYGQTLSGQYKRELCLSNMNYGPATIHIAENDQAAQSWLNALVSAGLYTPATPVSSGGYFAQPLMQYVATPELAKWRDGARLCLAKGVDIADVVDIEKPQEESFGRTGESGESKVLLVKAKLLLQSTDTAPWLDKTDVREAALGKVAGWEYKGAQLQKQMPEIYGLRDGKWATGPAYKAQLQQRYLARQRASGGEERTSSVGNSGFLAGFGAKLSSLLRFGGHPLIGKWRMDTDAMGKSLGVGLPSGLGLDVTMRVTADAIEVGGQSIKSKFEVDGNRVKVTPEGQIATMIFAMQDQDTASLDLGLLKVLYKRVE